MAEVYHAVAQRCGSRRTVDEVRRRFRAAFQDSEGEPQHRTCEDTERRRWREIVGTVLNDAADRERCFTELFAHFAGPTAWKCFADVGSTLEELKSRGFRLAVASNFDRRLYALCDAIPELRLLERRVISSEVGVRKPSPDFYRELLRQCGCRPDELLMIGDDPRNDVQAARQIGIPSLLLRRTAEDVEPGQLRSLTDLLDRTDAFPNGWC